MKGLEKIILLCYDLKNALMKFSKLCIHGTKRMDGGFSGCDRPVTEHKPNFPSERSG